MNNEGEWMDVELGNNKFPKSDSLLLQLLIYIVAKLGAFFFKDYNPNLNTAIIILNYYQTLNGYMNGGIDR